jgi:phospholipid/cholesterol/gamma-HCH transport system substrate-binding protein
VETQSNKILVVGFVALLVAAMVAFALWLTANQRSSGRPYDIVITQPVSGLVAGSPVTYLGVPVGRVISVGFDPVQTGAIRVRIDITDDSLAIGQGTVARLTGDLMFGTSLISLEHASSSAPPLLARNGNDAPLIPLESGAMGDLVNDPVPLMESIAAANERLLAASTPEQQRALTARLEEMERSTAAMAARPSTADASIARARQSMRDSAASSAETARRVDLMSRRLDRNGRTAIRELRTSLSGARDGSAALDRRLQTTRPAVQGFSQSLAGVGDQIIAARQRVAALQEQVQRVERGGVGAVLSGPPTPDYQPKQRR